MKLPILLAFPAALVCLLTAAMPATTAADNSPTSRPIAHINHPGLVKLGWQLACRASTFHDRTTYEMIDLLHSLGFHHIELSTGQILSPDHSSATISANMSADNIDGLLAKLKSVHMDVVSFGVVDPGHDETEARKIFDFGKRLNVKTIVVDPSDDSMELLSKLADEYRINVAIENLIKPGKHWDADSVAIALAGRSIRLGVCADLVNWKKSGLNPLECVQKLKGRIIEIHLADMDDLGREVPLANGTVDALGVLTELKTQGFKGICAIQYQDGTGPELVNQFTLSINAFSDIVSDLTAMH